MLSILLVDDEPAVRAVLAEVLRDAGHVVTTAADGAQALAQLDAMRFDLAITDVRLPKADGFAILSRIRRDAAPTGLATDVILISAYGSIAEAVSAMKLRALDYLSKPVVPEQLLALVGQVDERRRLQAERARFQLEAESQSGTPLLGRSPAMARLRQRIDQVAASDANVLLVGEPGTGKELVARVIHQRSARRAARFIAVSCAATTAAALEEELLGRDGANGSAIGSDGRLAAAEGGTLLLDAVAEVPREVQGRLLRALVPEGAEAAPPDVRIVSATDRDLGRLVAEGRFLAGLYYRLGIVEIAVPPLRERAGDLPVLVEHHLRRLAGSAPPPALSPRAWAALDHYRFPGNVRELQHALEHAMVLGGGKEIDLEHLPADVRGVDPDAPPAIHPVSRDVGLRPLSVAVDEFEREYLLRALQLANGERTRAAAMLGISRKCLWQKLRKNGVRRGMAQTRD